jgi:aspartyl/glutamyl-tRNA(Asn/Gln) amidotransferase C subunit
LDALDLVIFEKMVKLELPEDERKWVTEQTEKLFESFSVLENIDTPGSICIGSGCAPEREDAAVKTITREELLANAPEQYDGYFQIPGGVI